MIMDSRPFRGIAGVARATTLAAILCLACAGTPWLSISIAQTQTPVDTEAFLIQAEMHHDLAIHYLGKGEVDKALAEARQILQPRPPSQVEEAVSRSMIIIAEQLGSMHRYELSQTILDESLKALSQASSKIILLKHKSRLYYLAGETDKAIDAMRRAKALESR